MPSYARHAARREQEEREAAERRRREAEEAAGRKAEEVQKAPRPDAANEEVTPEFLFESHAREKRDTRAAQLGQKRGGVREPVGTRRDTFCPVFLCTPRPLVSFSFCSPSCSPGVATD